MHGGSVVRAWRSGNVCGYSALVPCRSSAGSWLRSRVSTERSAGRGPWLTGNGDRSDGDRTRIGGRSRRADQDRLVGPRMWQMFGRFG